MLHEFDEQVSFAPLELNAEQQDDGMIRDVLLCGNASKNGYTIPAEAFGGDEGAKRLYEGLPVYFDHCDLKRGQHPFHRESATIAGVIRNVRMKNGRPYGDIETIDSEEGRKLRSIVRAQPRHYGVSHIAKYDIDKRSKRIRRIEEAYSVDVVLNPATTRTFHENTDLKKGLMAEELWQERVEELKSERTSLNERLAALSSEKTQLENDLKSAKASLATADNSLAQLKAEHDELKGKFDALMAEQNQAQLRETVLAECAEAGLDTEDDKIVSKLFVESLLTSDEDARAELIAERVELVGRSKKLSKESSNDVRYPSRHNPNPKPKEFSTSGVLDTVKFRK